MMETDTVPARLSPSTLAQLNESVVQPDYEPSYFGTGIVHIGVGAFHRAHQAVYRAASSSVFRNSLVASLESIVRYGVRSAIGNYELRVERPRSEDVEPT